MSKKTSIAFGLVFALAGALSPFAARADGPPRRIVSFNLCADQLLLTLADPAQIAALSPYAADASLSVTAGLAAKFPRIGWDAESVVNLAPDLVLIGMSDRPMRAVLGATGLRVVEVELISDVAAARKQARDLGALVGHPERGAALAQELREAEARLAAAALSPPRTASVVERGGYTEGTSSLITTMLEVAGLRPPPDAPRGFGGFVSMEKLLIDGPDVLVLQDPPREATDQGALFITHPALLERYGPHRRIDLASRYTLCGGPALVQGLDVLRKALAPLR